MIWPRPAHANPQLSRTVDFADVNMHTPCSFHHVHGQSRKINQEFLFQGVDLEVIFFLHLFPSNPLRATSFFVCLRRLCLRCSPGGSQVLTQSYTLSLPLPSQIWAISTFLLFFFVLKRVGEVRIFVQSMHELQRYWINHKLSSLTIDPKKAPATHSRSSTHHSSLIHSFFEL